MKWLGRPDVWFVLAVVLIAAGGAAALNTRACKSLDERDWTGYGPMNAWQSAFDALSATCGAGLLTYDIDRDYTPRGRWLLTGLGVAGALLYLAAGWQATRRLWRACGADGGLPPVWLILATFAAGGLLSIPVVGGLEWLTAGTPQWDGVTWRALGAFASLGWLPGEPARAGMWIYALVALVGGLGWGVWLLPVIWRRWGSRGVRRVLAWAGGYIVFLTLLGLLVGALEAPRGIRPAEPDDTTLTGQPTASRYARSLVQTVCAASAGIPTEDLADRQVSDGTRLALAAAVLVGPLGGAAGGGIKWTLLLAGAGGVAVAMGFRRYSSDAAATRCFLAGTGCLLLLVGLTIVVAFGLLIIDTHTASAYQSPPTWAAAFLDASSAVGGADLSSGLFEAVTHRNLSRGIRQGADLYQYGMVWLMGGMLLGRALPLFMLGRAAVLQSHPRQVAMPPLA